MLRLTKASKCHHGRQDRRPKHLILLGLGEGRPANVARRIKCHVSEIVALVSNQTLKIHGRTRPRRLPVKVECAKPHRIKTYHSSRRKRAWRKSAHWPYGRQARAVGPSWGASKVSLRQHLLGGGRAKPADRSTKSGLKDCEIRSGQRGSNLHNGKELSAGAARIVGVIQFMRKGLIIDDAIIFIQRHHPQHEGIGR